MSRRVRRYNKVGLAEHRPVLSYFNLFNMNKKLLKTIFKIASTDNPAQPHNRPVFPNQITETGIPETTLAGELQELENNGLIWFIHQETNIVSLTPSGVMIAEVI